MKTVHLNADEVAKLMVIAAKQNPDDYQSPDMKALLYKCKAALEASVNNQNVKLTVDLQ